MTWCFRDEMTPASRHLLEQMEFETAAIPVWWHLEVANALLVGERRGRISLGEAAEFIEVLERLNLEIEDTSSESIYANVLPLARDHGLTAYDALYLEIAVRREIALATLD